MPSPTPTQSHNSSLNHSIHTTLTLFALRSGKISSALSSIIFGIFAVPGCGTLCDFNSSLSLIVVCGFGEIVPYKYSNIPSQLCNIYPKQDMNVSWFQTYIYKQKYLHIFQKHSNIHSIFQYQYCTIGHFDLDPQFHTALTTKV